MAKTAFRTSSALVGAFTAAFWALPAIAQAGAAQPRSPTVKADTASNADSDNGGLDSIVVYAQKKARGEALQSVPLAVSAVDGAALERSHAVDIRDVGRLVPNAQLDGVGTFIGFANFFMRGVGVSTSVRSLDPAVNIVQDGMVIGYQAGAVLDTFDTETVEVLRGPQGVLFGRNASGGVVSLRSKRPTNKFGLEAKLTVGNAGTMEFRGSLEGPIVEDKITARVALLHRNNEGFFTNSNHGTFVVVPTNVNPTGAAVAFHAVTGVPKIDETVAKATVVFKPVEGTTVTLLTQYLKYNDGGGATRSFYLPGTALRQQQTVWGWTPSDVKWGVNLGDSGYTNIEGYHVIGELEQEIGSGTLTAIGAYRHITYDATLNVGGDPFNTLRFPDNAERSNQTSFEARYNVSIGSRFDLLLGGFYFDQSSDVFEKRLQRLATTTLLRYTDNIWHQSTKSYAAFGNIDFHITDKFTLSGGLRYSKDTKRMHILPLTICPGQSFASCPMNFLDAERSWTDLSPRIVANYKLAPDVMVYASYSKGYRAGNFNARAPSAGGAVTPANPESVKSWEAGIKSELLDRHLRINLGYFYQKYDNIQRLVQTSLPGESPLQQLFNAAQATIQGVEFETSIVPFHGMRIDGAVGYTHAKYNSFNNLTGLAAGVNPTDLQFDRVPKWTAAISGSYEIPLGNDSKLSLHAGYTWRSHVFTDVLNTPFLEQNAYGLLDASAQVQMGQVTVGVFGRNIANTEYAEIKSAGIGYNAFGGSPRYYGAEVGFKF